MITIAVYLVLGFLLAWVANIVAKDDVPVWKGVVILFLTGVAQLALQIGLQDHSESLRSNVSPVFNVAMITVLTRFIAGLSWKHSVIIGAIYTVLLFVMGLAFTACMSIGA